MLSKTANSSRKWKSLALGLGLLSSLGAAAAISRVIAAELTGPDMVDRRIARLVAGLMPRRHLSAEALADVNSQRAMKQFLKGLDPMKLYFLQADIDVFMEKENALDDMVRQGDVSFAYEVFRKFLQRVDERLGTAEQLLNTSFDFARDEVIVTDADELAYAKDENEARERWRKQIKYSLLLLEEDGKTIPEALEQLKRRYQRSAKRWHQFSDDQLLELFLTSMTSSYDPHTTYMSPSTLDNFEISMRLNLEGIGAGLLEKDGETVISKIIPGGAADKHGELKEDDHIVSVGQGEAGEMVDIIETPVDEVVKLIRGAAGTIVRLGVKKGGVGETKIVKIVRAKVELEDSAARGEIVPVGKKADGSSYQVGYINLPSFYMDMEGARNNRPNFRSSTRDVARILADFRSQSVDAVVLDLSANGGGSLTEAINLTGLFIDRGPVVQVKDSEGKVEAYNDEDRGVAWDGPLVVVTTKFSASASEILAGAIKDYRRGLIVGDPATHGKGTVQTLLDLDREIFGGIGEGLGALKVTLQQFYLPDGMSTQRDGVAADVVLPSISAHLDISEGDLEYALPTDKVPAADHQMYQMVTPEVLGFVQTRSLDRVKSDPEFLKLLKRIDVYRAQKEETTIPLAKEKFKQYRTQLDSIQDEKEDEQKPDPDKVFADTYYNKEVVQIAVDYLQALEQQSLAKAN